VWSEVSDALHRGSTSSVTVRLSGGRTIETRFAAVREGSRVVGALVRVAETADLGAPRRTPGRRRADHTRFGWGSLTPTELLVAGLAVQGRTNREIADALTMSPHTVDSHVRHIYGKLGIASRIELTRVVLAH
jgi:DNA-binding NarL/FixJ family response regulator